MRTREILPKSSAGISSLNEIPTKIGLLTNLRDFDINQNRIFGTIPTEFGLLTNLEHIDIGDNYLKGPIPKEFGRLTNLTQTLSPSTSRIDACVPKETKCVCFDGMGGSAFAISMVFLTAKGMLIA